VGRLSTKRNRLSNRLPNYLENSTHLRAVKHFSTEEKQDKQKSLGKPDNQP
jgi:hypothetical protein